MKILMNLTLGIICTILSIQTFGQNPNQNIDPKWDNYYNNDPSGIGRNYKGIDFIKVIEFVDFKPQSQQLRKDVQLLKKALLIFDEADLNQMRITGSYFCRTFKHDDYFELYNLYYNKITKEVWDKYCPYLLPLMDLDGTINLH